MIRSGLVEIDVPLLLSRADYARARRAFYRTTGMGRRDDLLPPIAPPGSKVARKITGNVQSVEQIWNSMLAVFVAAPRYTQALNDPASDYALDPARYFFDAGQAFLSAYAGGGFTLNFGFGMPSYDPAPTPTASPLGEALVYATTDASMAPWTVGAWATDGFAQARDKTTDPGTDEWWYDTPWGREVVMEWAPPLVLGQFGGWQVAVPINLPAEDLVLVRVPLQWLPDAILPGPRFSTSTLPRGAGTFAQVRARRVFLPAGKHLDIIRTADGWLGRYLNPDESNFFERITDELSRTVTRIGAEVSRIDENVVNIVTDPVGVVAETVERAGEAIETAGEQVVAEVVRTTERVGEEIQRTAERVVEEVGRIDDNLKYYVVHPGDAAKAIGRNLTKAAIVAIIVFPVAGIGAQVLTLSLGEVAGAVSLLSPAAGSAISGLAASALVTAGGVQAGLAVALPPRTLDAIAQAAVYAEGFIPILPYALEELTIQAQGSARRRDELRLELAYLRERVIRDGGPWLRAAKQAVHAFVGLVIAAAAVGAMTAGALATLKSLAELVISAAETGYQLTNAREVVRQIQSRVRAQNAAEIAAAEEALRQMEAEIAAIEAEIAAHAAPAPPAATRPRGYGLGVGAAIAGVIGLGAIVASAKKKRR